MRLYVLLILTLLSLAYYQNSDVDTFKHSRILRTQNRLANNIVEYFYKDSKLIRVQSNKRLTEYKYFEKYIVRLTTDSLAGSFIIDTLKLNKYGLVEEMVTAKKTDVLNVYNYDSLGFCTEYTLFVKGSIIGRTTFSIANDNVTVTKTMDNSKILSTLFSCYDYNKFNSISNANLGTSFLGASSKNLKKEDVRIGSKGDTIAHLKYTYQFDTHGRVSQKNTIRNGDTIEAMFFTYLP